MAWRSYNGFLPNGQITRTWESAYSLCFGSIYLYDPVITTYPSYEIENLYPSAATYDTYNDGCAGSRLVYPVADTVTFNISAGADPLNIGAVINNAYIEATYTETVEYLARTENGTFISCYGDPFKTTFEASVVRNRGIACSFSIIDALSQDIYIYTPSSTDTGIGSVTHTGAILTNAGGVYSPRILQGACAPLSAWIGHIVEVKSNWNSYLTGPCGGGPPGTFIVRSTLDITDIKLWIDWDGGTPCQRHESGGGGNNVASIRTVTDGPVSGGNGQASVKRVVSMTGSSLGVADAIVPIIENRYSPCDIRTQGLTSGDNTITWVQNAVGVIIVMPSSNTTVDVKLKGAGGDTGVVLNKTGILQFERRYSDASFILNASAALEGVRFIYY